MLVLLISFLSGTSIGFNKTNLGLGTRKQFEIEQSQSAFVFVPSKNYKYLELQFELGNSVYEAPGIHFGIMNATKFSINLPKSAPIASLLIQYWILPSYICNNSYKSIYSTSDLRSQLIFHATGSSNKSCVFQLNQYSRINLNISNSPNSIVNLYTNTSVVDLIPIANTTYQNITNIEISEPFFFSINSISAGLNILFNSSFTPNDRTFGSDSCSFELSKMYTPHGIVLLDDLRDEYLIDCDSSRIKTSIWTILAFTLAGAIVLVLIVFAIVKCIKHLNKVQRIEEINIRPDSGRQSKRVTLNTDSLLSLEGQISAINSQDSSVLNHEDNLNKKNDNVIYFTRTNNQT